MTTDSSTVVGVDEQVRMVANATAAFDCLIVVFLLGLNCILEGLFCYYYVFIFYQFCLFELVFGPCILGLPTANSLCVRIIYIAV